MDSNSQKNTNNTNEDKIASLVKSINENPDMAHLDYTPAVFELITFEKEAIAAVLPLLNSTDKMERYRAQCVVEGVIQRNFGWKAGQGFPINSKGEELMREFWKANGNYNAAAVEKDRLAAIEKWEVWLTE